MSQLSEQIEQFRKMANDDPDNELGHYRLGKLLMDNGQYEDAIASFRRTLELSPQFSKVFQLLGESLAKLDRKDEAVKVLKEGYSIADERGDMLPRDEMGNLLTDLGEEPPAPKKKEAAPEGQPEGDGFRCKRPGCVAGAHARQLPQPPFNDEIGQQIYENVCAMCWEYWFRDLSIKVINEMRLDLSTEQGQEAYDRILRESLGLDL